MRFVGHMIIQTREVAVSAPPRASLKVCALLENTLEIHLPLSVLSLGYVLTDGEGWVGERRF